jgi:hypothetical protein
MVLPSILRDRIGPTEGGFTMTTALERLRTETSPVTDAEDLWKSAIRAAKQLPDDTRRAAGSGNESPAERLARLREALKGEMVAFHDRLPVVPYAGVELQAPPGRRLWQVGVPLTLFPRRDRGFDLVDCLVEFAPEHAGEELRVVGVAPRDRERVLATAGAGIGGVLQTEASVAQGVLPAAVAQALPLKVQEASARVYGHATVQLARDFYRQCVLAEIVRGTGARWRLDDPHDQRQVAAESHQLTIILEAGESAGPIHGAGYLQAHSTLRWMTATLGNLWESFAEYVRSFFSRGIPVEAYGEWKDILRPGT